MQNNQNSGENANLVISQNGQAVTTSLIVAEVFGKEHKNVIQAIENLGCSEKFSWLNFQPRKYENRGKLYPYYEITQKGFFMLGMSFTGKEAMAFKETFIEAFEAMENYIRSDSQLMYADNNLPFQIINDVEELKKFVRLLIEDNKKAKEDFEQSTEYTKALHERIFSIENIMENRPYAPKNFAQAPRSDFYIYFILNPNNGFTKIGKSINPNARLAVFQAIEPGATVELVINIRTAAQATSLETFLHHFFSDRHIERELFALGELHMAIVKSLKTIREL